MKSVRFGTQFASCTGDHMPSENKSVSAFVRQAATRTLAASVSQFEYTPHAAVHEQTGAATGESVTV